MHHVVFWGAFALGCGMIFLGIMLRLGRFRWMYLGRSLPVYAQREVLHLGIPIGLIWLAIVLPIAYPTSKEWADYMLLFSFFSTIVLAVWQPWWLKPTWLRWMEENYGHVLEELFAEARAMDRFKWAKQLRTQADLEVWADNVAQKHGWQRLR